MLRSLVGSEMCIRDRRYTVQIAATTSLVDITEKLKLKDVEYRVFKENDLYKYIVGNALDLPTAYTLRNDLLEKGCKGAFLIKIDISKRTFIN